jgi:molecular chaperone HtpG
MISDDKFYEKAKDFALLKTIDGKYYTIEEYKEAIKHNQTDKDQNIVALYTTDPGKQDSYIVSAQKRGYDVLKFEGILDNHFIGFIERKLDKFNLKRVDSEIIDKLIDKDEKLESVLNDSEKESLKEIYKKALNNDKLSLSVESLPVDELPVSITLPEFMRRMKDMSMGGGMAMMGDFPLLHNVVINANHPLTGKILKTENEEEKVKLAKQAYDIALLSQNMLSGKDLTQFIFRSVDLVAH